MVSHQQMGLTYFQKADQFLPERWERGTELNRKNPQFVYFPFGFGRRKCIGNRIAEIEIKILMVRIFQKYKVSWKYGPLGQITKVVSIPDQPLKFKFDKRDEA